MSKNIPSVTSDGGTSDGGPSVRTNGNAPSAPSSNTSTSQPVSYSAVNYADHFEGVGASYGLMRGNYVAEETHGVGANNQVLKNYGAQVYNLSDLPNVQGGANYSNYMRPDWVSNSSAEQIESLNNSQLHWNISGVDLNDELERDPNDNGLQSNRTFNTDDAYAARAKRMGEDLPENRYTTYEDPYVTRAKRLKQDPETNQIYANQGFNLTPEKFIQALNSSKDKYDQVSTGKDDYSGTTNKFADVAKQGVETLANQGAEALRTGNFENFGSGIFSQVAHGVARTFDEIVAENEGADPGQLLGPLFNHAVLFGDDVVKSFGGSGLNPTTRQGVQFMADYRQPTLDEILSKGEASGFFSNIHW